MVREFSEEKRQEIFRALDEIDNREWKSFMEWCGSSAEEFGDWPDKLSVSAYTRYVDEYHQKVLELNEMTRQRVNTVFENVAEIDTRYAARMRECQEKIKEQIAIVHTMTEFMQSMTDGNPNMALITKGDTNGNGGSLRVKDKGKEMMGEDSESPCADRTPIIDDNGYVYAGAATVLERIEIDEGAENLPEEDNAYENNEEDMAVLERYVNEETLTELGWDISVLNEKLDGDFVEQLKMSMLEGGIVDETSILFFLATIGAEIGTVTGSEVTFLENREDFDGLTYKSNTRGAGLMQVTGGTQEEFIEYLINHTEDKEERERLEYYSDGFETYTENIQGADGEMREIEVCVNEHTYDGMTVAEYIAAYYPIESAIWFWSYNRQSFEIDGQYLSINECIEQHTGEVSDSDMLLAVTCAVNGSEFTARGRGRFFNRDNSVAIIENKIIVLTVVDKTGDMAENPENDDNYQYTNDAGYRVYEFTSFIPNGWDKRLNLYGDLEN